MCLREVAAVLRRMMSGVVDERVMTTAADGDDEAVGSVVMVVEVSVGEACVA